MLQYVLTQLDCWELSSTRLLILSAANIIYLSSSYLFRKRILDKFFIRLSVWGSFVITISFVILSCCLINCFGNNILWSFKFNFISSQHLI